MSTCMKCLHILETFSLESLTIHVSVITRNCAETVLRHRKLQLCMNHRWFVFRYKTVKMLADFRCYAIVHIFKTSRVPSLEKDVDLYATNFYFCYFHVCYELCMNTVLANARYVKHSLDAFDIELPFKIVILKRKICQELQNPLKVKECFHLPLKSGNATCMQWKFYKMHIYGYIYIYIHAFMISSSFL